MTDNPILNRSEIDSVPAPEPHAPPAGDWKDDDGLALDSYFEAMPLGPVLYKLVEALGDFVNPPTKSSRIVRTRFTIAAGTSKSIMALPADADRTYLRITNITTGGSFVFHSEAFSFPSTIYDPTLNAAIITPPDDSGSSYALLELNHYTGPVWICGDNNASIIDVMAVTA